MNKKVNIKAVNWDMGEKENMNMYFFRQGKGGTQTTV